MCLILYASKQNIAEKYVTVKGEQKKMTLECFICADHVKL